MLKTESSPNELRMALDAHYDPSTTRDVEKISSEIEARIAAGIEVRTFTATETLQIARVAARAGILVGASNIEGWEAVRMANEEPILTGGTDSNPAPRPILEG